MPIKRIVKLIKFGDIFEQNGITVSKSKCPDAVKNRGTHVAIVYKGTDGKYYCDYNAIKNALVS